MIDSNLASDIFSDTLVNNTVTIIMIRSGAGYRSSDSESSAARASLSHDWNSDFTLRLELKKSGRFHSARPC
jgi:hypothetical protein